MRLELLLEPEDSTIFQLAMPLLEFHIIVFLAVIIQVSSDCQGN